MTTLPTPIADADAVTQISTILRRVEAGESFTIQRGGKPIAHLLPEATTNSDRARAAADWLKSLRGTISGVTIDQLIAEVHEGRPY